MASWPFSRRKSLTASVSLVPHDVKNPVGSNLGQRRSLDADWQKEAWAFYANLGEVRFCARYIGNALSRVRFYVGTREHPGDPVTPISDDASPEDLAARDALGRIKGRDGTLASLIRVYGIQQFICGESFLVGEDGLEGEHWEILSTSELRRLGKNRQIGGTTIETGGQTAEYARLRPDGTTVEIKPNSLVLRLWVRSPEFRERADSPMRPILDICDALSVAQAMQTAGDRSRLGSAGLFLIPAEADLPKAPTDDNAGGPRQPSRLMLLDDMLEVMRTSMTDPGSALARVPLMAEVKSELIEKFKLLTFDREIDKTIVQRIDHLIRRLAQGLDIPPEILLGLGDSSHWSAWAVSEETVSAHILPMAGNFCEDATIGFLHPTLALQGFKNVERYAVGADASDLIVSPNRADDAFRLYDRHLLGGEHVLWTLGFDASMMPTMEEIIREIEITRAVNPHNPDPGADIAALLGKAPPPLGSEKNVTGIDSRDQPAHNPQLPEPAPGDTQEVKDSKRRGTPKDGPPKGGGRPPASTREGRGVGKKGGRGIKKTAIISRMVGACALAIDRALMGAATQIKLKVGEDQIESFITSQGVLDRARIVEAGIDDERLFVGAWDSLRSLLAEWTECPECADAVVEGIELAVRQRLYNPDLDVYGTAQLLCEAATFDPEWDALEESASASELT